MKLKPLVKFLILQKNPLLESLGIFLEKKIYLHEGLIRSYPINKVIKILKKLKINDVYVRNDWNQNNPAISIVFHKDENFGSIDKIVKVMDNLGWMAIQVAGDTTYTTSTTFKKMDRDILNLNDEITIAFESKFVNEISYEDLSDKLYHLSPIERKDKILKQGLSPRSGDKLLSYPDRIYFLNFRGMDFDLSFSDEDLLKELGSQLYRYEKNKEKFSGKYVVFYVDKSFFKTNPIFHDTSFPGAVWTNVNIPPNKLKIEKIIEIEK